MTDRDLATAFARIAELEQAIDAHREAVTRHPRNISLDGVDLDLWDVITGKDR